MDRDSTRDTILAYIQTHPSATAADLAETLNLTGAAVRYHLAHLLKAKLIEMDPEKPSIQKRGRPAQRYSTSPGALPHNLIRLACALLEDRLSAGRSSADEVWEKLANHIVPSPTAHTSLNRRLPKAIEQLQRMNYSARWEAGPRGPRVLFANCPYAALLPSFPEICRMDRQIIENLLGKPVSQTSKMDLKNPRNHVCIFETYR